MDEIESKVDSKFRYVLLAAGRAEQLMRGASPRVTLRSTKVARVAMEELLDGCVEWDYGPAPETTNEESGSSSSEGTGAGGVS
jgi:DNA-directed RNA polymerase subunit omega